MHSLATSCYIKGEYMKSNKTFFGIIAAVFVVGIVAVVVLAMNRSSDESTNSSSNGNASSETGSSESASGEKVSIKDYKYGPESLTVKKGTTVTWTNEDSVGHTVTVTDASKGGPESELFKKGETFSYTFDEVGEFPYFCEPHPYMKASVTVTE